MTRKDLQEKYNILGKNKQIDLYRKKEEITYGMGWCGTISLIKGKAIFNDKSYDNIAELDNALVEWEKSLPFPVDTYNPIYRKSYKVANQLIWHLTEKLGFEQKDINWRAKYIKKIGDNCELSFSIERDIEKESVIISTSVGPYYFQQTVTETNEGITSISSIINYSCLSMAKDLINLISVCDTKINANIEAYVKTNENMFGIKAINFKDMIIIRLENVLNQLKKQI